MLSCKIDARLSKNGVVRNEKSKGKLSPCDADTVRTVKTLMLDESYGLQYISFVVWVENGAQHQRRFGSDGVAQRYSLQLRCRLEIDAFKRDLARAKPPSSETPPVVMDAVWKEAA